MATDDSIQNCAQKELFLCTLTAATFLPAVGHDSGSEVSHITSFNFKAFRLNCLKGDSETVAFMQSNESDRTSKVLSCLLKLY